MQHSDMRLAPKGSKAVPEVQEARRNQEERERLVAAAPELLAVLQPFIKIWAMGGSDYGRQMDLYWGYDNLNRARAAIAKATGEA